MKRADLIRHIESHGCFFVREDSKHTVYRNPANGASTTIPRHREIKKQLARKICMDLGIPGAVAFNVCRVILVIGSSFLS